MADITFKIVEAGCPLEESKKGWTLEINRVSWNSNAPKWDIRPWNEDHSKCGKGITLTDEQLEYLGEFISDRIGRGNTPNGQKRFAP